MSSSKLAAIISTLAPTISTALGSPFAGGAIKYLAGKFLGDENASIEDITKEISCASPERLSEIKRIDNEYQLKIKELEIDVLNLEVKDRNSARKLARQTTLMPQALISVTYLIVFFASVYFLFSGNLQVENSILTIATMLVGSMGAGQTQILNFWFGSSSGSKEKNELIKKNKI